MMWLALLRGEGMQKKSERDFSIKELAGIVGKHPETLRSLARRGRLIGAYRIGSEWRINREAFQAHRNGQVRRNGGGSGDGSGEDRR